MSHKHNVALDKVARDGGYYSSMLVRGRRSIIGRRLKRALTSRLKWISWLITLIQTSCMTWYKCCHCSCWQLMTFTHNALQTVFQLSCHVLQVPAWCLLFTQKPSQHCLALLYGRLSSSSCCWPWASTVLWGFTGTLSHNCNTCYFFQVACAFPPPRDINEVVMSLQAPVALLERKSFPECVLSDSSLCCRRWVGWSRWSRGWLMSSNSSTSTESSSPSSSSSPPFSFRSFVWQT